MSDEWIATAIQNIGATLAEIQTELALIKQRLDALERAMHDG